LADITSGSDRGKQKILQREGIKFQRKTITLRNSIRGGACLMFVLESDVVKCTVRSRK
jgi:hypothetical protein